MKNRRTDISCRIKKAIVSVAIDVATIIRELYAVDRKELIAQISERKRRKYKVALHMVNISKTITHLAMNYLLMKIMWQIVMDPPFGKETYMFSFEACRALFVCFAVIIADIECTRWMCTRYPLSYIPYLPSIFGMQISVESYGTNRLSIFLYISVNNERSSVLVSGTTEGGYR